MNMGSKLDEKQKSMFINEYNPNKNKNMVVYHDNK